MAALQTAGSRRIRRQEIPELLRIIVRLTRGASAGVRKRRTHQDASFSNRLIADTKLTRDRFAKIGRMVRRAPHRAHRTQTLRSNDAWAADQAINRGRKV
jgi:hypothetical protein